MPFYFWLTGSGDRSVALPVITATATAVIPSISVGGSSSLALPVITVAGTVTVPTITVEGLNGRDWDVLQAISDLLTETDQFDHVYLSNAMDRSAATTDSYFAELQLLDWQEIDDRDDNEDVEQLRQVRWTLTLSGRADDPVVRDRNLDRLQSLCQNTLDGQSLATLTLPGLTKLRRGSWKKPVSPSRQLVITGEFSYLVSNWDQHSTTE